MATGCFLFGAFPLRSSGRVFFLLGQSAIRRRSRKIARQHYDVFGSVEEERAPSIYRAGPWSPEAANEGAPFQSLFAHISNRSLIGTQRPSLQIHSERITLRTKAEFFGQHPTGGYPPEVNGQAARQRDDGFLAGGGMTLCGSWSNCSPPACRSIPRLKAADHARPARPSSDAIADCRAW